MGVAGERNRLAEQYPCCGRHVGLAHQALANQETPGPRRGQPPQVIRGTDAALGHQEAVGRDQRRQLLRYRKIGL
jgi:hypothetical protein